MGRQIIELVEVLVDRIYDYGYKQRSREDDIYEEKQKRIAAEKDRDHWKQARQEAHEAGELMKAEIETLRKELADANRAASDEFVERQVLTVEQQQDAAAWQQQVDSANAEVSYLQARLAEEWSVIADLRQRLADAQRAVSDAFAEVNSVREQLNAAQAAVTLQRAGIERLQAFVGKVRRILSSDSPYSNQLLGIEAALKTLDAGTEPTPVAETLDAEGGA